MTSSDQNWSRGWSDDDKKSSHELEEESLLQLNGQINLKKRTKKSMQIVVNIIQYNSRRGQVFKQECQIKITGAAIFPNSEDITCLFCLLLDYHHIESKTHLILFIPTHPIQFS